MGPCYVCCGERAIDWLEPDRGANVDMWESVMIMTKAVIKKVQSDFPIESQASALDILSLYGSRPQEVDVERIRLAALEQAHGDLDLVQDLIYGAKKDFGKSLQEMSDQQQGAQH